MRGYSAAMAMITVLVLVFPSQATAQRFTPPSFGSNLDINRSRIGDERVQRQTEISRVERLVETIDVRLTRLERRQLTSAQFPAITIAEAEAAVQFAELQLQESEYQFGRGESSKVDVARDRLALARAQGQLDSAKASHEERLLTLELDVAYAERQLFTLRQETELTQKFAAKGYTSTDTLQRVMLDEKLAEKELQLVKLRLQTQRKAADDGIEPELPANDLTPDEDSDATSVVQPPQPK